ncbi:MAG: hypothetical protein ACYCZD_05735 [Rhodanobacter sp.]
MSIVNISAYRTVPFRRLRVRLKQEIITMRQPAIRPEGGILKYLEQTDGAYWHGDCFVFDERMALDKQLRALPPLPCGETAGVRGHAGDGAEPGRPSINLPASTRPSSQPSPQARAGANATSAELDWSGA